MAPEEAEDSIWYVLACHVVMKRRSIVDVSLVTLEYDGVAFYESEVDPFEEKDEGKREAEKILTLLVES